MPSLRRHVRVEPADGRVLGAGVVSSGSRRHGQATVDSRGDRPRRVGCRPGGVGRRVLRRRLRLL